MFMCMTFHMLQSNGVVKQVITCESTDNIEPCPNGGRVIHIPGECCAKCGMFVSLWECFFPQHYIIMDV